MNDIIERLDAVLALCCYALTNPHPMGEEPAEGMLILLTEIRAELAEVAQ